MNYKAVAYLLGKIFLVLGALLCLPLSVCVYYTLQGFEEASPMSYIIPIAFLLVIGFILTVKKPKNTDIFTKEGFVICGLGWVIVSLFGCLPFIISGSIPSFVDAFFETVSGFTTTGSTILSEIESLPKSILFWRSFTHWIGGMGILSFMIAILPKAKGNTMYIMKAEVPGPSTGKVVSKIGSSARILYIIYFIMTVLEIAVLYFGTKITGENIRFFDCVANSFSTAGTGGFSVLNDSIKGYHSPFTEWTITVFMFLFGVNFNLYYYLLIKKFSAVFADEELRSYIIINLTGSILITLNICGMYDNVLTAVRDAFFNVNSVMSTSGFCTADFNQWPMFSKVILVLLMCVGACAGSTGGGFKVVRITLTTKQLFRDLRYALRPNAVVRVRMNNKTVDPQIMRGVGAYLNIYIIVLLISVFLVSLNNLDFATTLTSVITCMNNVGPGLNGVGPVENFSSLSVLTKLVLIFDMLAGRLELFPILLLFSPNTWKKAR